MANTSNHNSGRSWSADRRQSNKNESWEKPMSKRKQRYNDGGGIGGKVRMKLQDEGGFDEYLEEINFNFNENKIEFEDEDKIIVSKEIAEKFENDGVAYVLMGNELYKNGGGVKDWMNEKTRAVIITIQKNRPKGFHKKNGQDYIYTSYIADVADDMGIILTGKEMRLIAEGFNGSKFDNGGGVGNSELSFDMNNKNQFVFSHKDKFDNEHSVYIFSNGIFLFWVHTNNGIITSVEGSTKDEVENWYLNNEDEEYNITNEQHQVHVKDAQILNTQEYVSILQKMINNIESSKYSKGGGVGNIDWNNFSMQDVLNEYKKLKIDGEYEWQEDNRHWNEVGNLQTKFTLEGFDIGTFGMGEILHITLQVKNENIDASFNDSDGKRKNNRVRAKFIANIDFVNIKPNQQGGGLLDIKRMASDIVEQFPNYGGYDKEIFSKGGGINSGRDLLFKSNQPHEQAYKRKREFKKYGDNGNWYNDFFENGGGIDKQNALMVMNDNKQIKHHTEELNKVVDVNTTVPAWIVAKVHRSASDLSDATHYLDGVNTEFKNGGNVSYGEIKKEKERMTDELLKKCGVFFAFSNEQFNENKTPLKEGEKYVSIGGGGYMPKGNIDTFKEGMKSITKIGKKKVEENKLAETEILYELNNHECFYTGDYSDVIDMFKGTYTEQQIRDVYNKHIESDKQFKEGGNIEDSLLHHVLNHLSSGFVSLKLTDLGYNYTDSSNYKTIDEVKRRMVFIINENGDKEYSNNNLNNLIKEAAISLYGSGISDRLREVKNYSDFKETLETLLSIGIRNGNKTNQARVIIFKDITTELRGDKAKSWLNRFINEPNNFEWKNDWEEYVEDNIMEIGLGKDLRGIGSISYDDIQFEEGGKTEYSITAYLGEVISTDTAEMALGRKINSWKDEVIAIDGISYRKVFLKPEYKQIK